VFALHIRWAAPLGALGGPIWDLTQTSTAVVLAAIWIAGTLVMLMRLSLRLLREGHGAQTAHSLSTQDAASGFTREGIGVNFDDRRAASIEVLEMMAMPGM